MNCYTHNPTAAIGMCVICQRGICGKCIGRDQPRLVCRTCAERGTVLGLEYKSSITVGTWPLIHVCMGVDPVTARPRVAKGVIAVGNISVGALAIGGVALGLFTIGGLSVGLLMALGGAAIGLGFSVGGFAVGSVAVGGAAVGLRYALGGGAFGPAVIDPRHCDEAAREFFQRWLGGGGLPSSCR